MSFSKIAEHPEYAQLAGKIAQLVGSETKSYNALLYRFSERKYSRTRDFLNGAGAKQHGSRYGAPGAFPIVYGSTSPDLAMDEVSMNYKRYGLPPVFNHVVRTLECELIVTLDLTCPAIRKKLGVSRRLLVQGCFAADGWRTWQDQGKESLTQAIGHAAHSYRIQALLVPSEHSVRHHNVAIFPDMLDWGAHVKLLKLP